MAYPFGGFDLHGPWIFAQRKINSHYFIIAFRNGGCCFECCFDAGYIAYILCIVRRGTDGIAWFGLGLNGNWDSKRLCACEIPLEITIVME